MKLVSWNMAHRQQCWEHLEKTDADIALLQEAPAPYGHIDEWVTLGYGKRNWKAVVQPLSQTYEVVPIPTIPLIEAGQSDFSVSQPGTIAASKVIIPDQEPIIVISLYGLWIRSHATRGKGWIYADASVHRLISDLSAFIENQTKHRIIAAGDLNILYGYGEHGNQYWKGRYQTIFDRMEAIGLPFIGPQAPDGRQASPWPDELPENSLNVPTYYTAQQSPETASRQLDFVFASNAIKESISVKALNEPKEWGPSDHCQLEIEYLKG